MILDSLTNGELYYTLNPLFSKAFNYLNSVNLESLEVGRIELQADDLYVIVNDSSLKKQEKAKLEVHNDYIDIQIPLSKPEVFGWSARQQLNKEVAPFDKSKDIQFFNDLPISYHTVTPGCFIIFFPGDAHAPCIGEGMIRKIIVKVRNLKK